MKLKTLILGGIPRVVSMLEILKENTADIDLTIPWPDRLLELPINKALRFLGVIREARLDEFDTLGLGEYKTHALWRNIVQAQAINIITKQKFITGRA